MQALTDVVRSGKVHYIGASSMYAYQFLEMQYTARMFGLTEFVSMQNYYNAVYRFEETEMLPACGGLGVKSIPWSPLEQGFLARPAKDAEATVRGQVRKKQRSEADIKVNQAVERIAEKRGCNMAQVALAWVMKNPVVASPIVGISSLRSLDDAIKGAAMKLTEEEIKEIESPYVPKSVQGHT